MLKRQIKTLKRQIKTLIYTSLMLIVVMIFVAEKAFAFTDMSIEKLSKELQETLLQQKQGNKKVAVRLKRTLEILSKIDIEKHTQEETIAGLQRFVKEGKIPAYIFDKRGQYKYIENNNILYLVGKNIRLRSQPNTQARIVATLNTETTDYLTYLGEWKNLKGERWFLTQNSLNHNNNDDLGWIYGKYVRLVPNTKIQNIIATLKGQQTISDKRETSSDKKQISNRNTSLKIISIENHLHVTLKKYSFFGLIFWIISFFVVFMIIGWEFNLDNFLAFLFYSIAIAFGVLTVCCLVYFIWKNIILPIISAIMTVVGWLFVLAGSGGPGHNSGDEGATSSGPCSYYNRDYCKGCPKINPYNHKYIDFYTDIQWCNDLSRYVNPEKSPYDNINGY